MSRWSDLAEWRGPTENQGPGMTQWRGMVVHIAEGYYEGTISWQRNPDANVSSHFIVAGPLDPPKTQDADGKIAQMVDTSTSAWTQRNGNGKWISVENSGFTPGPLSPAQVESNAQLYARGVREYDWPFKLAQSPSDTGLGYHSMGCNDDWGHCDCPGPNIIAQLPAVLERAKAIVKGPQPKGTKMLIFIQGSDGAVWECDGILRRRIPPDKVVNLGYTLCGMWNPAINPTSTGLVGPVNGNVPPHVTIYTGTDPDFFGVDVATLGGNGGDPVLIEHTHDFSGTTEVGP